MIDLVLDTCTLVHANNYESEYQVHSIELIETLLGNQSFLTVDEGFEMDESVNDSFIGIEYIEHLKPGMYGYALVAHMAMNQRISFVSKKVPQNVKKFIEQKIRNKKDRHFLKVAYNSTEKDLVSHDFTDYQIKKRKVIKKFTGVIIETAKECNKKL